MSDSRLPLTDAPTHGDRTHTCGALRESDAGQTVVLKGWVDQRRNFGGLNFVDLRDRYGITQLVFSPELNAELAALAEKMRGEDVISAKGEVRVRERKNPDMATGDIEVYVSDLEVLARLGDDRRSWCPRTTRRRPSLPTRSPCGTATSTCAGAVPAQPDAAVASSTRARGATSTSTTSSRSRRRS